MSDKIIGLYNLEPRYKNLAIEKLRLYYRRKGCKIVDFPSLEQRCDIIYASSIFNFTNKNVVPYVAITGGTGYDLTTKLPNEVDKIKPHLNFGFTTRGCIRKCKFCVVPEKEGKIRVVGDLLDLWDGKSKEIVLYDNNILAIPEHFAFVCKQAREYKLKLDFNQGLDHRLLTPDIIDIMKSISHYEYRFAFDNPSYIKSVDRAITMLQQKGINRCNWYVLVGYDTSMTQDLLRLNYLRDRGQNAFVQRYRKNGETPEYLIPLARWANQHNVFQGMTWEQFLDLRENRYYKRLLVL